MLKWIQKTTRYKTNYFKKPKILGEISECQIGVVNRRIIHEPVPTHKKVASKALTMPLYLFGSHTKEGRLEVLADAGARVAAEVGVSHEYFARGSAATLGAHRVDRRFLYESMSEVDELYVNTSMSEIDV